MIPQFKAVQYTLEPEAFFNGTAFYKKVPTPMGSLNVVVDKRIFMRRLVAEHLRAFLFSHLRQAITPMTIAQIEQGLSGIVQVAVAKGEAWVTDILPDVLLDTSLDTVIEPQPEYFNGEPCSELPTFST